MAYFFQNFTGYLELNRAVTTTFPITMACWFAPLFETSQRSLISISNNTGAANRQFTLEVNFNSGVVRARQINAVATTTNLADILAPVWHHAAAVFVSDSDRTAYLDGIGVRDTTGTIANTGLAVTNIAAAYVFSASANEIFQGFIADAAIWQAALSPREVLDLSRGRRPRDLQPGSLLLNCPLERDAFDIAKGNLMIPTGPVFRVNYSPTAIKRLARIQRPDAFSAVSGSGSRIPNFIHHYKQQRAA